MSVFATSEENVWVTSCLIALEHLLLVVIHGSLTGSVICSNSGTEMSQAINRINTGTYSLENWSSCLVENKVQMYNCEFLIFNILLYSSLY